MVELEPIKDMGVTGNFEITLMQTKQLLHSKTTQGLGKCESEDERKRLFGFIRIYLDYLLKKAAKKAATTNQTIFRLIDDRMIGVISKRFLNTSYASTVMTTQNCSHDLKEHEYENLSVIKIASDMRDTESFIC